MGPNLQADAARYNYSCTLDVKTDALACFTLPPESFPSRAVSKNVPAGKGD